MPGTTLRVAQRRAGILVVRAHPPTGRHGGHGPNDGARTDDLNRSAGSPDAEHPGHIGGTAMRLRSPAHSDESGRGPRFGPQSGTRRRRRRRDPEGFKPPRSASTFGNTPIRSPLWRPDCSRSARLRGHPDRVLQRVLPGDGRPDLGHRHHAPTLDKPPHLLERRCGDLQRTTREGRGQTTMGQARSGNDSESRRHATGLRPPRPHAGG